MDRLVVEEKLESLRKCLLRIEGKCPQDVAQLVNDADVQDIITLNLTRAVQLSVDIAAHWVASVEEISVPNTMGGMFDALAQHGYLDGNIADRMRKSVGFRNVAVHQYEAIDWQVVYSICQHHLGDFTQFAKVSYAALQKNNGY